jgi:hypothetical protein
MHTPALLIVRPGRNIVIIPPAPVQFSAVYLLSWRSRVSRRNNGIILVHDDCTKIPAKAGPLVCTPQRKVKEILVAVGSHERRVVHGMVKNNPVRIAAGYLPIGEHQNRICIGSLHRNQPKSPPIS